MPFTWVCWITGLVFVLNESWGRAKISFHLAHSSKLPQGETPHHVLTFGPPPHTPHPSRDTLIPLRTPSSFWGHPHPSFLPRGCDRGTWCGVTEQTHSIQPVPCLPWLIPTPPGQRFIEQVLAPHVAQGSLPVPGLAAHPVLASLYRLTRGDRADALAYLS